MFPYKLILTPTEAGALLGCSAATIYNYIRQGLLKAYRIPGHKIIKIAYSDLLDFIEKWKRIEEPVLPLKRNSGCSPLFTVK